MSQFLRNLADKTLTATLGLLSIPNRIATSYDENGVKRHYDEDRDHGFTAFLADPQGIAKGEIARRYNHLADLSNRMTLGQASKKEIQQFPLYRNGLVNQLLLDRRLTESDAVTYAQKIQFNIAGGLGPFGVQGPKDPVLSKDGEHLRNDNGAPRYYRGTVQNITADAFVYRNECLRDQKLPLDATKSAKYNINVISTCALKTQYQTEQSTLSDAQNIIGYPAGVILGTIGLLWGTAPLASAYARRKADANKPRN